jgi:hypothetical protein
MDSAEALRLATCASSRLCLDPSAITDVRSRSVCSLWGGCGAVIELSITCSPSSSLPSLSPPVVFIAKVVDMPSNCGSLGDQRKKDSYDCEASFYANGHADKLCLAGCAVPRPLFVERRGQRGDGTGGVTICMTRLQETAVAASSTIDESRSRLVLTWLARLHAEYWGIERADAAIEAGLQPQGGFWCVPGR